MKSSQIVVKIMGILFMAAAVSLGTGLFGDTVGQSPSPSPQSSLPPISPYKADGSPQIMSLHEFHDYVLQKRGLIFDARVETTYKQGHVPGALSLPLEDFESGYAKWKQKLEADKRQPIVIYCAGFGCHASEMVQKKLIALGYTHVAVFPSGWPAWQKAQLPEEKSN